MQASCPFWVKILPSAGPERGPSRQGGMGGVPAYRSRSRLRAEQAGKGHNMEIILKCRETSACGQGA